MYSNRQLILCLVLVSLSLICFQGLNSVSGKGEMLYDKFLKMIAPLTSLSGKSDLLAVPIRKAIKATSFIKCPKPLTVFTALSETSLVNITKQSVIVTIENPVTVATLTGGFLGNQIYELHKYQFFWTNCFCNTTYNLKEQVLYFNTKYGSYEKATNYPDGVVVATFPIATNGDYDNPKFSQFSNILSTKWKHPGQAIKVQSAITYTWFVNFQLLSIYSTGEEIVQDPDLGKKYHAITLNFPLDQRKNYISHIQYQNTFGAIGSSDKCVDESFSGGFEDPLNKKNYQGIYVCNLPA